MKFFSHPLASGQVAIIRIPDSTPAKEAKALQKTLFELHREELTNGAMTGDELAQWQRSVHFEDYRGPRPWSARPVQLSDIPTDRSRRHAWRDDGAKIFDDPTVLDA